jgi:hypothetical protein
MEEKKKSENLSKLEKEIQRRINRREAENNALRKILDRLRNKYS